MSILHLWSSRWIPSGIQPPQLLLLSACLILLPLGFLPAKSEPRCAGTKEPDAAEIDRLIRQLGSAEFRERKTASKALEDIGEPALALLQRAARNADDLEIRHRAKLISENILRRDYQRLQGTWRVVKMKCAGIEIHESWYKDFRMVVANNSIEYLPSHEKFKYKLDSTKRPREFEATNHQEVFDDDETAKGIYLLEGNRLTVCVVTCKGQRRPTRFQTSEDSSNVLCVLERIRGSAAPAKSSHPPRKSGRR